MSPVIGVLALQGDVAEHRRAVTGTGGSAVAVRRPAELEAVDGLIIPGGESTTMWKLADVFELMEPLRKRIANGLPVFGSCAGMIMLATDLLDRIEGQETLATRSAARSTRSSPTSTSGGWTARRSARCSSGPRGSSRPGPASRFWAPSRARVGSSRSARGPCSRRRFTRS